MSDQKKQNPQMLEEDGRQPVQNPTDINRDRGSFEPGSDEPEKAKKTTGDREIPVREGEEMEEPDRDRDLDDPNRDDRDIRADQR